MRKDFAIKYLTALELIERPLGATIKELQQALGNVSDRTVYRVLDSLQDKGVPVYNELDVYGPTNQKRWKLMGKIGERERDGLVQLDQKERLILSLALQNTKLFETGSLKEKIDELTWKLGRRGILHQSDRAGDLHVSLKRRKDYSGKERIIRTILTALEKREVCTVTYSALSTGLTKTYNIHPLTLMEYDNGLYLLAAVPKHGQDIRVLAVDRIQDLSAKAEHFEPPSGYNPEQLLAASFGIFIEDPIQVELKFSAAAAPYIRERIWAEEQCIEACEDGGLILRFRAAGREEIKRWILSFGSAVKVIGPESLVTMVREELQGACANYE